VANRSVPAAYLLGGHSRAELQPRSSAATPSRGTGATFRLPASRSTGTVSGPSVLAAGGRYLGTRYEMGGGRSAGPVRSIDCSAFVSRAYADASGGAINLTAYTDTMHGETTPVAAADARPGDLVFYRGTDSSQPGTE
jgi:cell wall-associated NlpC family hydrolase